MVFKCFPNDRNHSPTQYVKNTGTSNHVLCDNLAGWERVGGGREVQEGEDICIPMSHSCQCMAETNTIL